MGNTYPFPAVSKNMTWRGYRQYDWERRGERGRTRMSSLE